MADGGAILCNFAGKIFEALAPWAYKEVCLALDPKAAISNLNQTVSWVREMVSEAEQQRDSKQEATTWHRQLPDVLSDAGDLYDDLKTEGLRRTMMSGNEVVKKVRIFFSKSNQLAYNLKIGHRAIAITKTADNIAANKAKFPSGRPEELADEQKERDQTYSSVADEGIIGRDVDKRKIVELLLQSKSKSKPEQNVSVVPIVGFGGLGKTTLAQMVFNDAKLRKHFDLKLWVCVSEKLELRVIVEKILRAAFRRKIEEGLEMEILQRRLPDRIKEKKYLLVLDDVWDEDSEKWHKLKKLLSDGAKGSWIVITTRSQVVAEITGTVSAHNLEGLSKAESLSLLKRTAFTGKGPESNDSQLEEIGMEIAERCKGVPLALKAIGRILFNNITEAAWERVKNHAHEHITDRGTGILSILKLSYYHLPQHLRKCFAYCSLIPRNTEFEVTELVLLWMAQGFIQPQNRDDNIEEVGHGYFMELLWRSFFQVASKDGSRNVKSFTMHDLLQDLACSVAGDDCCIASFEAENVEERARHVSFEDKFDSSWKIPSNLRKAKRLRTFIQKRGGSLNISTCSALISGFKYLRVLKLSNSVMERLPVSIGKLKHLRYLDLSGNPNIIKLPSSLSRLQNLQTLDLKQCKRLEKLPRETRKLVSLRHLCVDGCDGLVYMPCGLGQITCLRTLSKFVVGKRGGQVAELKELNGLKNLRGELRVSFLQNAIPEPGSTYLKDKLNLKSLEFSWSGEEDDEDDMIDANVEMVFECLQPHQNLQKLQVKGYPGSKISSWLSSIKNLTELSLFYCGNCKHLPPLHQLFSLKVLVLFTLKALENVSEIEKQKELESTTIFLQSLMVFHIVQCPNLKGWWRGDVGGASNAKLPYFPCLSDLYIEGCPNRTSMPLFPSVRVMELRTTSWEPVQQTMKLKRTTSEAASSSSSSSPSSSSSSSIFPPFSNLETLQLEVIEDLDSLPEEFLQNLTSLQYLGIERCIKLRSMPKAMHYLTSLRQLRINGCPHLSERCRMKIGDDWPNINHIEDVQIDSNPEG